MARLALSLLGSFRVSLDAAAVTTFESDKVRALLAYLAAEADRPHRREALVGMLWPDSSEQVARRNPSQALFNLRHAIGNAEATPPYFHSGASHPRQAHMGGGNPQPGAEPLGHPTGL